jgi:hypothetical protein
VEKLPFLGGVSTAVLDTFYGFYPPGSRAAKVVGGVADDVVGGLEALGPVVRRPNTYGAGTGVTYQPEHLKVVWEELAVRAGVRVLLHAMLQDVEVRDGRAEALVLATKAGLARVRASVVVDASGDADLCHFADFGYELAGELEPAQTLTTSFRLVNVDLARRAQVGKDELHARMRAAVESGDYDLPRRDGSDHITTVPGQTATVMTRIQSTVREGERTVGPTDPEFLTRAEIAGRRQALEYVRFLVDRVPGYEHAALGGLSTQIGVRESRRVHGDARLTREDVLGARQFDDQVGLCGAPIEDHHGSAARGGTGGTGTSWHYLPDGAVVGIPYGTLLVRDAANALVAGRCFSATHDAHAAVRSMAQCMAMGQAAGTAAALAVRDGVDPRDVDRSRLLDVLRAHGAVLEQPVAAGAGAARTA